MTVINSLTLNGTIDINANSTLAIGAPNGTTTIGGTGVITFGTSPINNIILKNDTVLYIDKNITIQGANGNITGGDSSGVGLINNSGKVLANVSGGSITIFLDNGGINNYGTLGALNGGTLELFSTMVSNAGEIVAKNGGIITQIASWIGGGTITTDSSSVLRAYDSRANNLVNITLNGTLDMATFQGFERVNGLTLNGAINIDRNSILSFSNSQTLLTTSHGEILFGNAGANNYIALEGNSTLTIASGILVHGASGSIGQNSTFADGKQSIVNNGRIIADVAGGTIYLSPNGGTTNAGTLGATNGGTLVLRSQTRGLSGSQIRADGGIVLQDGASISGIVNVTKGALQVSSNSSNYLYAATLTGKMDMATNFGFQNVVGGLVLNGTIDVNNNSILSFNGEQNLTTTSGSGVAYITFGNTGAYNQLALARQTTLIIGPNVVVHGENGTVGATDGSGLTQVLVNNGRISADVQGGVIHLAPVNGTVNNGILEARNGGTLVLDTNVIGAVGNPLSKVFAGDRSVVVQNGVTIIGNIETAGTGLVKVSNDVNNFLHAATLTGTLDLTSSGFERVRQGLTLNGGTVKMDSSVLSFQGDQSLGGTGTIVLGAPASVGHNTLGLEGDTTLTIGSGVLVHGRRGYIGDALFAVGNQSIINNGTVNSDGGESISIGVSGSLTNNGTLRAQSGSMEIQTALTGAGTLQVDSTGVLTLSNSLNRQGFLVMGAMGSTLNIGTQNLIVDSNYSNAASGSGNAFNKRAGITGTGLIVAGGNAAQAISGAQVSNGATPTATLTIGNVRVGSTTLNYQVANTGTTGPSLRGAVQTSVNGANLTDGRLSGAGATPGNYTAGAPGSSSANLGLTFSAAAAGALAPLTGQVLNLRSNFDNIADQKLSIVLAAGAAAYNVANPTLNTPSVVLAARVGDAAPVASIGLTNTSADSFTERLNASLGAVTAGFTGAGSAIVGLTAGSTSNGLKVALNTSVAGSFAGTAGLNLVSSGVGTTGAADAALAAQSVALSGRVYTTAVAQLNSTTIDFGIVHRGDTVTMRGVSVTNAAALTALNDTLNGSVSTTSTHFSASGGTGNLGAKATDASGLKVGINTTDAGVFSGTATASFSSHNNNMSDLALASSVIQLKGQVNNHAQVAITQTGLGTWSQVGHTYTLDFGSFTLGSGDHGADLAVLNDVFGPADLLSGSFDTTNVGAGFAVKGFGPFANLAAGHSFGGLNISFLSGVKGSFQSTLVLHSSAGNASGYSETFDDRTLVLRGAVTDGMGFPTPIAEPGSVEGPAVAAVPEPGTYALMLAGLLGVAGVARSRQRRRIQGAA